MATKSVNKVILIGHLGQDPEVRYTGGGTPVCSLRIATNDSYKNKDGDLVEKTEWHSIVAWARLAEICGEYLRKGSQVYIEGSLQTRQWEDRDGNTRYTTEVKAREMVMLGGRGSEGSGGGYGSQSAEGGSEQPAYQPAQQQSAQQQSAQPSNGSGAPLTGNSFDVEDELPF